ncbi:iron-containing alcohol dehydrogenase [Planococcus salinarum]|uniref:iron-containing alcohol dehydrogenase n=1 Tax=Planococcus salinarum TaxID=622695 RepID=UPI00163D3D64|nr:iron-containing alcohol dehydrogenase [Planococcus salinarum]
MSQLASTTHFAPRIIHGAGSISNLKAACEAIQATSLFVMISERGKKSLAKTFEHLAANGISLHYFTAFQSEPTTGHLQDALVSFERSKDDGILAIGGGTALDLGKALSVLAANKGLTLRDIPQQGPLNKIPLIAMPTTAGTGSEVTKVTVITETKQKRKLNPGHPSLIPDVVVLDPELTLSMSPKITAETGLDALAHAIEAYVSTRATPISDVFALEAIRAIGGSIRTAYREPQNLQARDDMLRGSMFAGLAFSNSSTNLAHATARPLGTRFSLPHGLSVALMHPYVIAFGKEAAHERYTAIADALGAKSVLYFIEELNALFELKEEARKRLDLDELIRSIPLLVEDALSGNGIETNRKIPTRQDITDIYKNLVTDLMGE